VSTGQLIRKLAEHHAQKTGVRWVGINWGGAFVMFEKVRGPDARFQDILVSLYNDFKQRNGFSTEGNLGLLRRAGFTDTTTVFKYLCFEGFLAIK